MAVPYRFSGDMFFRYHTASFFVAQKCVNRSYLYIRKALNDILKKFCKLTHWLHFPRLLVGEKPILVLLLRWAPTMLATAQGCFYKAQEQL